MSRETKYPEWILCKDKIPEYEVICCDVCGNMLIGYISPYHSGEYVAESKCEFMYNVVKWMPLPEP